MLQQNSPEWHAFRRTKIGASDAAVIMGVSPWSTPEQLWLEKKGLREPKTMTPWMQRGLEMQEEALVFFERKTGITMFPEVKTHPQHDWMIASLDGIDFTGTKILEIKCPGHKAHSIAMSGEIPPYYMPQLQHQMAVCGVDSAYYLSYDGNDGIILEVQKDPVYVKALIETCRQFYESLSANECPYSTKMDISSEMDRNTKQYIACELELKELAERKEMLRELILKEYTVDGIYGALKITKTSRVGPVDYACIPELDGVNLAQYRKPGTESIKITIVGSNGT